MLEFRKDDVGLAVWWEQDHGPFEWVLVGHIRRGADAPIVRIGDENYWFFAPVAGQFFSVGMLQRIGQRISDMNGCNFKQE